jgi:hypothetical protein
LKEEYLQESANISSSVSNVTLDKQQKVQVEDKPRSVPVPVTLSYEKISLRSAAVKAEVVP